MLSIASLMENTFCWDLAHKPWPRAGGRIEQLVIATRCLDRNLLCPEMYWRDPPEDKNLFNSCLLRNFDQHLQDGLRREIRRRRRMKEVPVRFGFFRGTFSQLQP